MIFNCRIGQNQWLLSSIYVSRHVKTVKCLCANSVGAVGLDRLCWAGLTLLSPVAGSSAVWSPSLLVQVSQGSPLHTRSTGTSSETSPASSPCGPAQTRSTPCCTGRTPGTLALCAARSWCASWRCDTSPWSGQSWHPAPWWPIMCTVIVSVVGNLSLALITATLSFRIYKSVLAAVNKTNEGHPFKVSQASDT